jgi:hypothetical protein
MKIIGYVLADTAIPTSVAIMAKQITHLVCGTPIKEGGRFRPVIEVYVVGRAEPIRILGDIHDLEDSLADNSAFE